MTDSDTHQALKGAFAAAGQAHHAATGGVNPQWAKWYAEYLLEDVNRISEMQMSVDELADWLSDADQKYRAEGPDVSWPRAYATWLLEGTD